MRGTAWVLGQSGKEAVVSAVCLAGREVGGQLGCRPFRSCWRLLPQAEEASGAVLFWGGGRPAEFGAWI